MNKNIENIIEFNYSNGESLYTNIDNVRIEMANGYVSKLTIIDERSGDCGRIEGCGC